MTEIDNVLKNWQPMQDAFNDLDFNSYKTGPGAGLPAILHATHANIEVKPTNEQEPAPRPYLTLRNVPKTLNLHGLENLCRRYGNIQKLYYSDKCNMYFVYFATLCDMEVTYKHLLDNEFGFNVYVGQQKKETTITPELSTDDELAPIEPPTGPQFDRRRIPLSEKLTKRPFVKPPDIIENPTTPLLAANDPLGFYLFANDTFALDLAGMAGDPKRFSLTGKYSYFAGRAFLELTADQEALLQLPSKLKEYTQGNGKNLFAKMNFGNCVNCHLPCMSKCATKQVFACSVDCLKQLDQQAIYQQPEFPASGSKVCIVSINCANVVFIREKSPAADIAFLKLTSKIHNKSLKATKLRLPPVTGQIVVTKFNNLMQRAIVLNAQNLQAVLLMCLDYGNMLEKPITELYTASAEFQQLPRLVRPVILKDLDDFYMSENLRTFLYAQLQNTIYRLRYDKTSDFREPFKTYAVQLIEAATNDNLNQFIYRLCNAVPPTVKELAEVITENDMKTWPLTTGQNTELMVMDTSWLSNGFVYCSHKAYVLEIQRFQKDIARYMAAGKDLASYTPRPHELCLAKYSVDNQWYRGIGIETVGDGFPTIQFLDFGNVVAVPLHDIRRYPKQFQFPICTHVCKIEGLPSDEKLVSRYSKRLEQLLQAQESIICDQVGQGEDEHGCLYVIQINDIVKQLENEGLLSDPNSAID